jgi:hypothetical protein
MKKNVGSIDKVIRFLLALVVIVLFFMHVITGTLGIILLILSAILIFTILVSFCPIYWPFGISTDKAKE